jgi:hypothetical protein
VPRPPFPKTLREFQSEFATEEACQQYLAACRWPDGFVCPRCGNRRVYELAKLRRWQCTGCRHQVSLTAETILHNTKTPLTTWFWAAYLMTTDKRGVSALLLQRQAEHDESVVRLSRDLPSDGVVKGTVCERKQRLVEAGAKPVIDILVFVCDLGVTQIQTEVLVPVWFIKKTVPPSGHPWSPERTNLGTHR